MTKDTTEQDEEKVMETNPTEEKSKKQEATSKDEQIEKLQNELNEQIQKAKDSFDEMLRAKAEVENIQRRAKIDIENAHKYGQDNFARELLSIVDSLHRGMESIQNPEEEKVKDIYTGMELTYKLLLDTLEKFNISQISPEGETFDPKKHEAIATEESNEIEPNKIIKVFQTGFSIHGRLLRPALVVVAKAVNTPKIDENA